MAKDPAFSFYAQDYLVDTIQWSRGAKSLHVDLLAISWINGYIEANEKGEPIGLSQEDIELWNSRVKHKWQLKDGRLTNSKQEEGREKRKQFLEGQREKGKKSAEKRAENFSSTKKSVVRKKKETNKEPIINHGSTAVEPQLNHLKTEKEKEKEKEIEKEIEKGFVKEKTEEGTGETKNQHWQMWVDAWFEFYKSRNNGIKPVFSPVQAKALKQIRSHMREIAISQTPDQPPDMAGLNAWQYILRQWDCLDTWLRTQFDLTVIHKKLNDIINQLKNGSSKKHHSGTEINTARAFAKIDSFFAEAGK